MDGFHGSRAGNERDERQPLSVHRSVSPSGYRRTRARRRRRAPAAAESERAPPSGETNGETLSRRRGSSDLGRVRGSAAVEKWYIFLGWMNYTSIVLL